MRNIEVINMECRATAGARIDVAIWEAILLAVTEKRNVTIKHNCHVYTVDYDAVYSLVEKTEKEVKDGVK